MRATMMPHRQLILLDLRGLNTNRDNESPIARCHILGGRGPSEPARSNNMRPLRGSLGCPHSSTGPRT